MFSAADIQNQPNTLKKDLHHMRSKLMANLVTIYVIETKTEFIYAIYWTNYTLFKVC
jgi:hypothetical protein